MSEEFVSCIGVATAYSLVELCKSLDQIPFSGVNRLQSATTEHGLSCSIVLLAVAMTESALNRARYIAGGGPKKALDFFRSHIGKPDIADDLEEAYVLRDAIIHNHMWKVIVPDPSNLNDPRIIYSLLPGYGDRTKFPRVVNMSTQKTKRLSLNVVPTKINREDVVTVLGVVWRVCVALQLKDPRYFPLENFPLPWFESQYFNFPDLVSFLTRRWRASHNNDSP